MIHPRLLPSIFVLRADESRLLLFSLLWEFSDFVAARLEKSLQID